MTALRADGVTLVRNGRTLLDGIDLDIGEAEIVALLGRSGAGKTVLLSTLAGLVPATGGTIRTAHPVSLCFQEPRLIDRLSVLENTCFGGLADVAWWRAVMGTPAAVKRKALGALGDVGLWDRANERAGHLSGGQRQRAAMARTLVGARAVLLLDEPTAHLDPATEAEIADLIRRLRDLHRLSILVATHSPALALGVANRIAFLRDGRLTGVRAVADTTPADVSDFFDAMVPC